MVRCFFFFFSGLLLRCWVQTSQLRVTPKQIDVVVPKLFGLRTGHRLPHPNPANNTVLAANNTVELKVLKECTALFYGGVG